MQNRMDNQVLEKQMDCPELDDAVDRDDSGGSRDPKRQKLESETTSPDFNSTVDHAALKLDSCETAATRCTPAAEIDESIPTPLTDQGVPTNDKNDQVEISGTAEHAEEPDSKPDKPRSDNIDVAAVQQDIASCEFSVETEESIGFQIPEPDYSEMVNIEDVAQSLRTAFPNDLWVWRADLSAQAANYPKPFDSRAFLNRPARQQVEASDGAKYAYTQGNDEFNIWYGRYATDRGDSKFRIVEPSSTRLDYYLDVGYTAAKNITTPICLYFAKGCCAFGSRCIYRHQLPTTQDEVMMDASHDVFGRARSSTHRDDMDGIGSFFEPCDTLFISNLSFSGLQAELEVIKMARINAISAPLTIHSLSNEIIKSLNNYDLSTPQSFQDAAAALAEQIIVHEFSPFGVILEVRVIYRKQIAFIRFASRVYAEFAKVALHGQKLPLITECMAVRWAHARGMNRIKEEEKPYQNIEPKAHSKDGPHANFFRGIQAAKNAAAPSPLQQVQSALVQNLYEDCQTEEYRKKKRAEYSQEIASREQQFHELLKKIEMQNTAFHIDA